MKKEKDPKVEIVEPPTTSKQINEILQRMERDAQEEPLEKDPTLIMHG